VDLVALADFDLKLTLNRSSYAYGIIKNITFWKKTSKYADFRLDVFRPCSTTLIPNQPTQSLAWF
jgi:hypothetical protein